MTDSNDRPNAINLMAFPILGERLSGSIALSHSQIQQTTSGAGLHQPRGVTSCLRSDCFCVRSRQIPQTTTPAGSQKHQQAKIQQTLLKAELGQKGAPNQEAK